MVTVFIVWLRDTDLCPKRCPTSSNPVLLPSWTVVCLSFTLLVLMLFRDCPVVNLRIIVCTIACIKSTAAVTIQWNSVCFLYSQSIFELMCLSGTESDFDRRVGQVHGDSSWTTAVHFSYHGIKEVRCSFPSTYKTLAHQRNWVVGVGGWLLMQFLYVQFFRIYTKPEFPVIDANRM